MTVTRNLTRRFIVSAVVAGTLGSSSAAFAATASEPSPAAKTAVAQPQVLKQGMNVVSFNAATAKAHGYKIVTYANGDQQSVPVDPKSKLPKSPILHHGMQPLNSDYDRVVGNCGVSWISVRQTAASQVQVGSGFTVSSPAISYNWTISLSDRNGTSHQSSSGGLFFKETWARVWSNLNQHGYTFDYVSSGLAELANGTVCYAGRPSVSISGLS
ncbi:hypothetical protein [Streptomyces sp. HUAS TT7]|uniref:hypothetical protein n=1 Tax=Streptomyces sp. HUAS TT7 TaxID=3447507 RepID=UPI003F657363